MAVWAGQQDGQKQFASLGLTLQASQRRGPMHAEGNFIGIQPGSPAELGFREFVRPALEEVQTELVAVVAQIPAGAQHLLPREVPVPVPP